MPYKLNQVLERTLDLHYEDKYNVYAVLEILKHPEDYPNIRNVIFFGVGLLQDYQFYFQTEKTGEKPDAPDDRDEAAWIELLEHDTEWLKRMESSVLSCPFFDEVTETVEREDWVPDLPQNVIDAYCDDLKELRRAFDTVAGSDALPEELPF